MTLVLCSSKFSTNKIKYTHHQFDLVLLRLLLKFDFDEAKVGKLESAGHGQTRFDV